jgi:hypothetical protein
MAEMAYAPLLTTTVLAPQALGFPSRPAALAARPRAPPALI